MFALFQFFSFWPLRVLHALGGALGWGVWVCSPGYRQRFRTNVRQAGVSFDAAKPAIAEVTLCGRVAQAVAAAF